MEFDHIGLEAKIKKGDENWVEKTKVWVTNPKKHPFHVEWLRYREDSPVDANLRARPHIAFRVDNIEEASKGLTVIHEPFKVGDFARVGFYEYKDGLKIELMEYLKENSQWFDK